MSNKKKKKNTFTYRFSFSPLTSVLRGVLYLTISTHTQNKWRSLKKKSSVTIKVKIWPFNLNKTPSFKLTYSLSSPQWLYSDQLSVQCNELWVWIRECEPLSQRRSRSWEVKHYPAGEQIRCFATSPAVQCTEKEVLWSKTRLDHTENFVKKREEKWT